MQRISTSSLGFQERIDWSEDKIPDYDPRSGNHFWIIIGTWRCDPKNKQTILDHESLVSVTPPGCYYCEQLYTDLLATRRCKGNAK